MNRHLFVMTIRRRLGPLRCASTACCQVLGMYSRRVVSWAGGAIPLRGTTQSQQRSRRRRTWSCVCIRSLQVFAANPLRQSHPTTWRHYHGRLTARSSHSGRLSANTESELMGPRVGLLFLHQALGEPSATVSYVGIRLGPLPLDKSGKRTWASFSRHCLTRRSLAHRSRPIPKVQTPAAPPEVWGAVLPFGAVPVRAVRDSSKLQHISFSPGQCFEHAGWSTGPTASSSIGRAFQVATRM